MQTARIPMAILLALELSSTACTSMVQPCLNVAPYDDGEEDPERKLDIGAEPYVGPCLSPIEPDDPPVTPCLEVTLPEEPALTPCLMVVRPPEGDTGNQANPTRVPPKSSEEEGLTARADVVEKLADTLPPDVLAKLRKRQE